MPPVSDESVVETATDMYSEADDFPIGESDSYLVSMVASVEAEPRIKPHRLSKRTVRGGSKSQTQLCRRALLINGES